MMSSHFFVILSLVFPLPSITGQSSASTPEFSTVKILEKNNKDWQIFSNNNHTCLHGNENEQGLATPTTNLKSWKGPDASSHKHYLRNAHGILNMIGWGGFLPIGVIIARNCRKVPLKCEEWYNLHVVCQTSGYIIGAVGWGFGLWLGNSSNHHHHTFKTHRILGIVIFTFATVQIVVAVCMQPKRGEERSRWWLIYHKLLGYALIAIIIVNIFEGIDNQPHSDKWRWIYVGLLVILGLVAIALEIFRCFKPTISPPYSI